MFDYRAGLRIGITNSINLDISGSYGESENRQTQSKATSCPRASAPPLYTTSATSCNLGRRRRRFPIRIRRCRRSRTRVRARPRARAASRSTSSAAPGSITPAMISYLTAHATDAQKTSLAQARALLNGDFGASLPWAEIRSASPSAAISPLQGNPISGRALARRPASSAAPAPPC